MIEFLHSIGIEQTGTIITGFAITLVLSLVAIISTRRMEEVPHGLQNAVEWVVTSLYNFFEGIMGKKACERYFPLVATMFLFILFSNYAGLLPLSGKLPWLQAPTSSINVSMGLAIVVFFATQIVGFREYHGPRYLLTFFKPVVFLAPLMIIEQFTRPLSLTLRLYGNIFGEEAVVDSFFELVPIALPVALQAVSILMGLVQALVFSLLTAVYLAEITEMAEEDERKRTLKLTQGVEQ